MCSSGEPLARLVEAVLTSPRYHAIQPGLVSRIAAQELARQRSAKKPRSAKETLKAVKNKLHQVAGAYLENPPAWNAWLAELAQVSETGSRASLLAACRRMMAAHASTRERLPILDRFYAETLAGLPPLRSVLDLACGLNPLAIPWMGLSPGAAYTAVDIYTDLQAFLTGAMPLLGVNGTAQTMDVVESPPDLGRGVDLALILKTIPCLEQVEKTAGLRLLEAVQASYLLVSFPARSLGGRQKGMLQNYEARFGEIVSGKPWAIQRFEFPSELAFLVKKEAS
jgi:16S rRNA (guanine(1405)-N(7))-methyltransferase